MRTLINVTDRQTYTQPRRHSNCRANALRRANKTLSLAWTLRDSVTVSRVMRLTSQGSREHQDKTLAENRENREKSRDKLVCQVTVCHVLTAS